MAYRIPRRQWSRRPPPNFEPVHLTSDGIARLEARLARLKRDLPAAIEEVSRTSAFGDRSDNAEYKEAKSILRRMHRQIVSIEDQLKRVAVIPSGRAPDGKVRIGSIVVVKSEKDTADGAAAERTYHIVGSSETDPVHGRISHTSPLGAALIGRGEGEAVIVRTPRGIQKLSIVIIR